MVEAGIKDYFVNKIQSAMNAGKTFAEAAEEAGLTRLSGSEIFYFRIGNSDSNVLFFKERRRQEARA